MNTIILTANAMFYLITSDSKSSCSTSLAQHLEGVSADLGPSKRSKTFQNAASAGSARNQLLGGIFVPLIYMILNLIKAIWLRYISLFSHCYIIK